MLVRPSSVGARRYATQLFHLYDLNRRAPLLLRDAGRADFMDAGAIVVRWRPDVETTNVTRVREFLEACVRLVATDATALCVAPTPRTRDVPPRCLSGGVSSDGVAYGASTCCHPKGRGVLSDWVFVARKSMLDALDGSSKPSRVSASRDRTEHRFCDTFVGAGLRLAWPAFAADWSGHAAMGIGAVRCAGGATATFGNVDPDRKPGEQQQTQAHHSRGVGHHPHHQAEPPPVG